MNELFGITYDAEVTHKTWYHFTKYMKRWYFTKHKYNKREYKEFDSSKMVGYSAMQRVERYKKKYGGIKTTYVDDNVFAGSLLVLIPHKDMGITTIFIPQLTSESNIFFLYPDHIIQLFKTINSMKKEIGMEE